MEINAIISAVKSVVNDDEVIKEVEAKLHANGRSKLLENINKLFPSTGSGLLNIKELLTESKRNGNDSLAILTEAIIHLQARPALLITNDTFQNPDSDVLALRLNQSRTVINQAIKSVGRIELRNHQQLGWAGTGWMVAPNLVATNRHVAETFSMSLGSTWQGINRIVFKPNMVSGLPIKSSIDFKKEGHSNDTLEFEIEDVKYLAANGQPDLALLGVRPSNVRYQMLPAPIGLETDISNKVNTNVVTIGYPAFDDRSRSVVDMNRIFGFTYEVKRLQPGRVTQIKGSNIFEHDCSTLGGNSGSPIIDIDTGKAIGIHFAGEYLKTNYAVASSHIMDVINRL